MNTLNRKKISFCAGIIIFLMAAGCENPLRAGLGPVVDINPPSFTMDSRSLYLRGEETFTGSARDDIAVAFIKVRISVIRDGEEEFYDWEDVAYDSSARKWSFTVDTAEKDGELDKYPDGLFSLQFRIQDTSSRAAVETGKFAYTVKNSPPVIEMSIPSLNGTRKGGEFSSAGETGFNDPYSSVKYELDANTVPSSGALVGSITDLQGIAEGYPKIQYWPVTLSENPPGDVKNLEHDDDGIPGNDPAVYGGWDDVQFNETPEALAAGPKFLQFTFPLVKWRKNAAGEVYQTDDPLDPVDYYFRFKVKDIDPRTEEETIYPIYEAANPDYPNRAVKIKLVTPKSTPEVRLYDDDNENTPLPSKWVTTDPAYKSGGFTLSIIAQDQDGIRSAEIKLSKEGDLAEYPPIYFNTPLDDTNAPALSNPNGLPQDTGRTINGETKRFDYTVNADSLEFKSSGGIGGPGIYRYQIKVYAKSGNTRNVSYRVYVDGESPSMDLGNILGAVERDQSVADGYNVNGTISIPVNIYDSMGLMNRIVDGKGVQEKKWFLSQTNYDLESYVNGSMSAADKTALETFFNRVPDAGATPPEGDYFTDPRPASPQGDSYYSGFIAADGSLKLDTTKYNNSETDNVWYFYIYAMDQAYNRRIRKLTFYINQAYDKPVVKDAVVAELSGFDAITGDARSNIFTANSKFSLTLTDDEGLDLSGVEIKIKGITDYSHYIESEWTEKTISPADAAAIFGGASYDGARTRSGSLTQGALAAALYAGTPFDQQTTLRDGQYIITVSVKDLFSSKQYPVGHTQNPTDPTDPQYPATGIATYYIVKDTRDPRIELDSAILNALKTPVTGPYFSLTGTVRDENKIDGGTAGTPNTPGTGFAYLLGSGEASAGTALYLTPLHTDAEGKAAPTDSGSYEGLYEYTFDTGNIDVGTTTGNRDIYLFAKDIYGTAYYRYAVVLKVDGEPPALNLNSFNRIVTKTGDPVKYINQTVNFSVTANDINGIGKEPGDKDKIRWFFAPAGTLPTGPVTDDPDTANNEIDDYFAHALAHEFDLSRKLGQTYTADINTAAAAYTDGAPYDLIVLAGDTAGNTVAKVLDTYTIDQAGDKPKIKLDRIGNLSIAPIEQAVAPVYALTDTTSGLRISGTLTDDDGFLAAQENASVLVQYSPDNGVNWYWFYDSVKPGDSTGPISNPAVVPLNPGDFNPPPTANSWATGTASTFDLSFEAYIPNNDDYLNDGEMNSTTPGSQGIKKFRIIVYDSQGMKVDTVNDERAFFISDDYEFIVDTRPPLIEFDPTIRPDATLPNGGFSNAHGDVPIRGTVTEDNVRSKNDGSGDYDISFSLMAFDRETTDPITWPATAQLVDTGTTSSEGLKIYKFDASIPGAFIERLNGSNTVKITVEDKSSQISTVDWNLTIDAEGPTINFDNIRKESIRPDDENIMVLTTPQVSIKGSFTDNVPLYESGHDISLPERGYFSYRIDYPADDDANWIDYGKPYQVKLRTTGLTVNWELPVSDATLADGNHPGTGADHQTEHNLPDGLHWVDVKYTDLVDNPSEDDTIHTGENSTGKFYRAYFKIDRSAPALTVDAAPEEPYGDFSAKGDEDEAFNFSGTARDALFTEISAHIGISELGAAAFPLNPGDSITYAKWDGSPLTEPDATYEVVPGTNSPYIAGDMRQTKWTITVSKKTLADLKRTVDGVETTEHGEYSLFVQANDESGGRTMLEYKFKKDLKAPELSSTVFTGDSSAFKLVGQNPQISGSAYDAFKIKSLISTIQQYKYTRVPDPPDTWEGTWVDVAGEKDKDLSTSSVPNRETVPWTKSLSSLTTFPDGLYRIRISATDYSTSGNPSYMPSKDGWQEFYIDRTAPVLRIESTRRVYKEPGSGTLDFTGTVTDFSIEAAAIKDGNRVNSVRAKLVKSGQTFSGRDPGAYTGNNSKVWEVPQSNNNIEHNWTLNLLVAGLEEAEYTLHILALDDSGNAAYDDSRKLVYDTTPPAWSITSPVSVEINDGNITFTRHPVLGGGTEQKAWGGTSDANGVESIQYYFGVKAPGDVQENEWTDGFIYQSGGEKGQPDGTADPLRLVRSNSAWYNWELTFPRLDKFLDASFLSSIITANVPTSQAGYVGTDTVTGTYVDGKSGVWELPVLFRVTDAAENTAIYEQKFWIDSRSSDPAVSITRPGDGESLGGEITLGGSAVDDVWVNKVVFRVVDPGTGVPKVLNGFTSDVGTNDLFASLGGNVNDRGWYEAKINETQRGSPFTWSVLLNSNGELNAESGEKTWRIEALAWDATGAVSPARDNPYHIAGDNTDLALLKEATAKINVTFVKNAPEILVRGVEHSAAPAAPYASYADNMTFAGEFTLHASVFIASGTTVNTISYQGTDSNPAVLYANGVKTTDSALAAQIDNGSPGTGEHADFTEYKLAIPVSQAMLDALGAPLANDGTLGGTKHYTLSLNASDKVPYRAQETLDFNIDNRYPQGSYTNGTTTAVGSSYAIFGSAEDQADSIGDIDRVVVYFARNNIPISLREADGAAFVPGTPLANVKDMADGGKIKTLPFYPDLDLVDTEPYTPPAKHSGIIINRNEVSDSRSSGGDGDGYVEGFVDQGSGKNWSVRFNTLQLNGGPVVLHYVIFDKTGHAVHYEQNLFIKNLNPTVTGITPITKSGKGEKLSGVRVSTNYDAIDFTVKNEYLGFKVDSSLGNRKMNYRITYLEAAPAEKTAAELVAGQLYRIKTQGDTVWTSVGAANNSANTVFIATGPGTGTGIAYDYSASPFIEKLGVTIPSTGVLSEEIDGFDDFSGIAEASFSGARFALKVWDQVDLVNTAEKDQLSSLVVLGLNINNEDTSAPVMTLYNLNPNGIPAVGANEAATIAAAAAPPIASGTNRARGGLYNRGTSNIPVWSGHIEPSKTTSIPGLANMTGFTNDTLSGTVILRGSATDSHRVKEISVETGDDSALVILGTKAVDDGTLEPKNGVLAYYTEEYTLAGHRVEWAYIWNTEQKPAGLINGSGVSVTATAGDGSLPSAGSAITVDIRPFIQKIERTRAGAANNRSVQGWYSASQNETLKISGYNLYKTGGGNATLSIAGGNAIDATSPSLNELQFAIGAAVGGKLVLKSNVSATEAVNNIQGSTGKTNVRAWNKENSGVQGSDLWDDGRYIHVWDSASGSFPSSGNAKEISMTAGLDGVTTNLYGAWADRGNQSIYQANPGVAPIRRYYASDNSYDTDSHYSSTEGLLTSFVLYNAYYNSGSSSLANAGGLLVTGPGVGATNSVIDDNDGPIKMLANAYDISTSFSRPDRFQRPRMVSDGVQVHTSYYDKYTHALRYSYAGSVDNDTELNSSSTDVIREVIDGSTGTTYEDNPTNDVGSWSSIDLLTTGSPALPVVAYYDATRDTVKLAVRRNSADRPYSLKSTFTSPYPANWASLSDSGKNDWLTSAGIYNDTLGSNAANRRNAWTAKNAKQRLEYLMEHPNTSSMDYWPNWTKMDLLPAADPYHDGSGTYVSLKVERKTAPAEDVLHLAFFNTNETALIYATGSIYHYPKAAYTVAGTDTAPTVEWRNSDSIVVTRDSVNFRLTGMSSVLVDSGVNNGTWADLSLDSGKNPWITYLDIGRAGRSDGVRVAYKNNRFTKPATDYNGQSSTGWEAMTAASAAYSVQADERLNIEGRLGTGGNWDAAVGYKSSDLFRLNYYTKLDDAKLGTLLKE